MNASQAAAALLSELHAPKGAVTVVPRHEHGGIVLEVLLDDRASGYRDRVPSKFCGFRTRVNRRQAFTALFH